MQDHATLDSVWPVMIVPMWPIVVLRKGYKELNSAYVVDRVAKLDDSSLSRTFFLYIYEPVAPISAHNYEMQTNRD